MSYVKTTWVTGDIVTAPKLNNLESGVEANDLNKLNKPSGNGTAGQLLISNGDGSTSWTDTDTTLEESGKAADAKAVGDALGEINEALETKAEIDGYYEEMTVGDAEQLVSTVYVEESTPYLYRTTGGSADVGNREYLDKLVGVSVPWNQIVPTEYRDFTSTTSDTRALYFVLRKSISPYTTLFQKQNVQAGVLSSIVNSTFDGYAEMTHSGAQRNIRITPNNVYSFITGHKYLFTLNIISADTSTVGGVVCNDIQIFDLTAAFGTTIADYVYNLETATAGSGVAWLKQYINLDTYHAYDAGTMKHVEGLTSHDTVGFNQWDEEWELGSLNGGTGLPVNSDLLIRSKNFDKCFPGMAYYLYCGFGTNKMNVFWYDANQDFISVTTIKNEVATSPSNAHYFKIRSEQSYGNVYRNDTCINLSWSGYRNGEYEPYEKHSYALDSSVVLRGVPKLDSDNQLVYDGDEYLYDGTINRRYGIVDMGTLPWNTTNPDQGVYWLYRSDLVNIGANIPSNTVPINAVCPKYIAVAGNARTSENKRFPYSMWYTTENAYFGVCDVALAGSTAAQFKAAMSGVYLVYELATPTTETADPYTQVQICDDFGTEQFVTTSIIPVGTATRYPANLRDKLQHLPSLAETDGTYLIQQTNKDMSLIPLAPILEDYVTEESFTETLEDYAKTDGYYEGMTVGNAEELVTGLTEEENVPFIFRTSGGSLEIGAREEMTVTGGSLAWNQMVQNGNFASDSGWSPSSGSLSVSDGKCTFTKTTDSNLGAIRRTDLIAPIINHKYLLQATITPSQGIGSGFYLGDETTSLVQLEGNKRTTIGAVKQINSAASGYIYVYLGRGAYPLAENETAVVENVMCIDLTQLFGTTIADYIYSLEQTTEGAGVAYFKKLFPKDYYPYQTADLVHVNASEFKTVGFNQCNDTIHIGHFWESGILVTNKGNNYAAIDEKIKALPQTDYCAYLPDMETATRVYLIQYDADGNFVSSKNDTFSGQAIFHTDENIHFISFGFYKSSGLSIGERICVSIHWDNTRNGEYEPYTEHSYPLDSNLVLRGIPKIDADGNLYYDGDTYEADGTVTRRYGIVDLGTIQFGLNPGTTAQFYGPLPARATTNTDNCICTKYLYGTAYNNTPNCIQPRGTNCWIVDSNYSTGTELRQALSGVYLVYELATPTTETADPYQTPQIVDNWGTEQFTVTAQNGVEVPVGHSTIYPISLRDKLEAAPDLPDDDGDFVLRMSSGGASYARLASEFPAVPTSTDGVFVLKATVTNGTATLTWEAQS